MTKFVNVNEFLLQVPDDFVLAYNSTVGEYVTNGKHDIYTVNSAIVDSEGMYADAVYVVNSDESILQNSLYFDSLDLALFYIKEQV